MEPLVSIVSGTFNRLKHLKQMVESARKELYLRLPYEFVIVDGGSTDGTIEWCNTQSDIRFIEQGKLLGAIKAFGDGARAARGRYVIMANDDISFLPYSIIAAVKYLETTAQCAAVAFADNRLNVLGYRQTEYNVDVVTGRRSDGTEVTIPYAQVGMFRRDVGDVAGWWGDRDPLMSQARTYGADNFLSARIWEMGYTVDAVEYCRIKDHIIRDALRDVNGGESGQRDSQIYYTRYPVVPISDKPALAKIDPSIRILYCPIYEPGYPGNHNNDYFVGDALAEYGQVVEWDYVNVRGSLVNFVRAWQPDLLFLQCHDTNIIKPEDLEAARRYCPNMVVVNWNGDAYEAGLTGVDILKLLRYVDIQLVINAKTIDLYKRVGIKSAYWQIPYKIPHDYAEGGRKYDVLFQGNCYDNRRKELVGVLRTVSPLLQVGIYGDCPGSNGDTHYSFSAQRSLYSQCLVAIGDTYPGTYGFISNRFVQALSSGAFLLQQHSPGFDEFNGTKAGLHYVEWTDLDDLKDKIIYWVNPRQDALRQKIAQAGQQFVVENFSPDAQVKKLFADILPLMEIKDAIN